MEKIYKIVPLDLLIILIWIVMTVIFVITQSLENSLIRTILGIPMVLFIPGYVLVSVLFLKMDDLGTVRRIALSFGLSIVIIPLFGLILNFTFGLTLIPIIITLCIYDIVLVLASKYRREKLPENDRFSVKFGEIYDLIGISELRPKGGIDFILTIILLCTTILAIGMIYYVIMTPRIGETFTEFYVLNADDKANNYTTNMKLGSSSDLLIYVSNHEHKTVNYTIQVDIDKKVLIYEKLKLNNNDIWKRNMTFVPDKDSDNMRLEFLLFKEDNLTTYRELHLWANVSR